MRALALALFAAALIAAPAWAAAPDGISPEAVSAFQMIDSGDEHQQQLGFLRLEALREPATAPAIRQLTRHNEPRVRAFSLRALAAVDGAPAVPELIEALARDQYPDVRRAALLAMEPFESGDDRVLHAMMSALTDPHFEVRITAVDAVSRVDDPAAREAIRERRKRENDRNVRRAIDLAVARLGL